MHENLCAQLSRIYILSDKTCICINKIGKFCTKTKMETMNKFVNAQQKTDVTLPQLTRDWTTGPTSELISSQTCIKADTYIYTYTRYFFLLWWKKPVSIIWLGNIYIYSKSADFLFQDTDLLYLPWQNIDFLQTFG